MPLLASVVHWMTLPARLTVAAAETTLALGLLVGPQGPVRRPNGYADRVLQLIGEGGLIERLATALADPQGPMRLVNVIVDALDPDGTVDRLVAVDGPLDRLVASGGPLDRLLALGATLERIQPRLGELARLIPELHASVGALNAAVVPLGDLANKLPGRRRAAIEA